MPDPNDLQHDYKVLVLTQTTVALTTIALLAVLYGLWSGTTPEDLCVPIGLAGVTATIGAMWYASTHLVDKTGGDVLASWSGLIRTMAMINGIVSVVVIAYPNIP